MILRPYDDYDHGYAAYVFGCGTLGQCAVVDARVEDVDAYASFANSKGMRVTRVIDTHVHADHRSGGRQLAERTGASYCLHESADVATRDKILTLPGDVEIYPGRFSGSLCGAGLSGKPTSTINRGLADTQVPA